MKRNRFSFLKFYVCFPEHASSSKDQHASQRRQPHAELTGYVFKPADDKIIPKNRLDSLAAPV